MRVLTWNINGVRTLPQYHPWNTLKTHDDILNHLQADIICFQEMKSSRTNLLKPVALPPSYTSFFSFPIRKAGYSGVATYLRTPLVPLKAEEGLCGFIQPKPPLTPEERVSGAEAYPQAVIRDEDVSKPLIEGEEREEEGIELDYKDLDSEGRVLVIDLGLFVLINVYCPNDGTGSPLRDAYKAAFHRVLEARVRGLIEREGREVVVVGDLNACAGVLDHCEGPIMVAQGKAEGLEGEDGFWGKDVRRWLRDWVGESGCMVDVVRRAWPDRKGMYTCWNTKISARDSNYGTRIDFILTTPGLLPWIKHADIQPEIKGSDHCPVFLDLHDEIIDGQGKVVTLRDVLGVGKEVPRIASKHWDEYSGKQTSLQSFFGKKNGGKVGLGMITTTKSKEEERYTKTTETIPPSQPPLASTSALALDPTHHETEPLSSFNADPPPTQSRSPTSTPTPPQPASSTPVPLKAAPTLENIPTPTPIYPTPSGSSSTTKPPKRKLTTDTLGSSSKKQKQKQQTQTISQAQTKLSTFFAKPKPEINSSSASPPSESTSPIEQDLEADHALALLLSQAPPSPPHLSQSQSQSSLIEDMKDKAGSKQAWQNLLAPTPPPLCLVHGEPAKEMTVGKQGVNKGKKFFVCSRPVGPGYDKGRAERMREHVDPTWKCDFFKWASEVRREVQKEARRGGM